MKYMKLVSFNFLNYFFTRAWLFRRLGNFNAIEIKSTSNMGTSKAGLSQHAKNIPGEKLHAVLNML